MTKSARSICEMGEGEPILFLHGYLSNKESFIYQTEYLSRFRRTIAIDLPGFGATPEPTFAYSLGDYVDFVYGVIEERCGGRADILAHSFGGRIALKLAAEKPSAVNKMLLTGCAGMKPRRSLKYYAKTSLYKIVKRLSPKYAEVMRGRVASADYLALSPVMRESFKKIVNEHLEYALDKITAPTLLVFGEEDGETPLYMARRIERGIEDCALVLLDGCGHFCFCENPVRFNAIAEEFFA